MVSRFSSCDPNRLRLLLDDSLPERSQADLARHVETCRRCRQRLETLAAEASWWNDAAEMLSPCEEDGPTDRQLHSTLTETYRGPDRNDFPDRGPRLGFLSPSDDPKNLGQLGPYQIEEVIGHGGMGIVLKGYEPTLNRHVAVKVLAPHLATSGAARQRFDREAKAAAAVVHEHVVAIHAVSSADGVPYLVMPFVPGTSLDRRINDTGPMEVSEILRIGMQISKGLAAAHAQGLVHRDVKPANIILEHGIERVMLTDFGLALAVDDASLTQSGVVAGTPQYMSPEQAKGEPVDHRADLFSLGSVMYAMCTGRPPFRAQATLAILRKISESPPRSIGEVNPRIPDWLVEIIEKLHEKSPSDRFQTASEVAELLGRHLAHLQHPKAAPMPPRLTRKRRVRGRIGTWIIRRRLVWPVFLLIGLAGLWAIAETAGIKNVVRFMTGTETDGLPEVPAGSVSSNAIEAEPELGYSATIESSGSPRLPVETRLDAPSDAALWDDGVEGKLDESQRRIRDLKKAVSGRQERLEVPDESAAVERKLSELEQEIKGDWP